MGGTMTGRRESPARLGDLSTTSQIVLHSLRVTNSSGDQKQEAAMTAALSAQRTLFAVSTMRGGRALCRFPHRTLRVMAASSHHAGSSSSSSAQSEQRRRLVRAAASRQQTSSDGPELAESSSLKRFLISGAAAAALLLAAATPRPAAAFQMPGGLFGGAPQPAAVATKVEAAPAVMENKTPLPDLSQLSMEEIKTVTLFKENTPCVVNIANIANARRYYSTDILKIPQGQGSGFVWDHNGHIVTNYHVIRGASEVQVSLIDQSTWPATIVGGDPSKDVAVLQLQAPKEVLAELKPIELGNSSGLFVGQQVFAIGNPFGLDHTLTSGIISGLNRELNTGYGGGAALRNVIQSDASINPGNSGGPLLDSRGRLIGINTAIYDPTGKGSSSGIGFAIPIDTVRGLVDQILTYGRVVRPVLGITIAPPQALRQMGLQGVLVLDVPPGTPAAKAGLQGITRDDYGRMSIGDVIVGMNGKPVKSEGDLFGVLDDCKVGDKVTVDVLRGGNKKRTLTVQLAERVPDATE